jgi:ribonuclease-3
MNDAERLAIARGKLLERVESLAGEGPIARFEEALTHASFANETGKPDNQRLEFLGDSVLGLCVSELLADLYAQADEGLLTRMRSALVNAEALAAWARRVALGECIALGRGAMAGSERHQTNVLADAAEAVVAAVYIARGLERDMVDDGLAQAERLAAPDPKSALQERLQGAGKPAPTYRLAQTAEEGREMVFEVEVMLESDVLGRGRGRSKRLAERAAAEAALAKLD